MVSALGDTGHSTFLSPEMVKSEHSYTQGSFEGIGAEVESKDGHVVIVAPFDNSPAQKAGLRAGDAILKVDGSDVSGLPLEQVVGKILGPAGTSVTRTLPGPEEAPPPVAALLSTNVHCEKSTSIDWPYRPPPSMALP